MKTTKRILAALVALALVFCLGTVAFAAGEQTGSTEPLTITLDKKYVIENAGTKAPAQDFYFAFEPYAVTNSVITDVSKMPKIDVGAALNEDGHSYYKVAFDEINETTTKPFSITLPEFGKIGVYTYRLIEKAANEAGITNEPRNMYLVVTVYEGPNGKLAVSHVHFGTAESADKDDTIVNTYKAGNLVIHKDVTGNMGDKDKLFNVTVTLKGEPGKTYSGTYTRSDKEGSEGYTFTFDENGEATLTLQVKDNTTITIGNLPYGVTYTVAEDVYDGYKATYTFDDNGDAKIIDSAVENVKIENYKDSEIDTGVILDSIPYILTLVVIGGVVIAIIAKKRLAKSY